ncbi:MAG: ABC transporter permease [Planctomycetota bacterium]|jgi:ribose transport system permease protein|nr:ABC transporter permease [Planctomycetota bacterium]
MAQVITVGIGLVFLCVVFWQINPLFFSQRNIDNLSRQIVPILLVGIAQSYVLITGNIDLSIGSVAGMSCMISATLMAAGYNPWLSIVFTLACCLCIGWLNGVLVARCKLPPFIATLGTMTIARGIAQIANNNYNTDYIGDSSQTFRDMFYYGKSLSVFNPVWLALILWLVFNFILSRTRTGRHIYAIGSNVEASRLSGVNVAHTTNIAYLVSAFCSAVVGLYFTATTGMGAMDSGNMYELYAVAAAVIGGVSTLGGQGLLLGTIIGASIWAVLQNGLQFAKAPVAIQNIVVGAIVIISVLLDVILRNGMFSKKRKTVV